MKHKVDHVPNLYEKKVVNFSRKMKIVVPGAMTAVKNGKYVTDIFLFMASSQAF